jgi:amino acid transporter
MSTQYKLSLWMAILVNVSIMFGAGFFINTVVLAQRAGSLCFLGYIIIAILMIPLIISIGKLLAQYPTGGFYTYAAKPLSPLMGFISCWSYFIGKLGSAVVIIDLFARLIKSIIPSLAAVSSATISVVIITFFVICNMFNMKTNMSIIYTFIVLKLIPVCATAICSLWLWNNWSLPAETFYWSNLPSAVPIVLFALVGFEAACSISRTIQDPQKNAPKAVFYSFGIVVSLTSLYQLLFFLPLNTTLMAQQNYLGAFPALLGLVFPGHETIAYVVTKILHICIAAAALGGSYGILFSNHWNLYTLAENNHIFFSRFLTTMNRHNVPFMCVIIEAIVCLAYVLCAGNNQLFLQQINVLGCSIAYVMSVVGLATLQHKNNASTQEKTITALALGSCFIFIGTCIKNLLIDGPAGLLIYSLLIVLGIGMFFASTKLQGHKSYKA